MKNAILTKLNKLPIQSGRYDGEWVTGQEEILSDAKRYIEATNEGRLFAIVRSVAKSGTSRVVDFGEFVQHEKATGETIGFHLNFIRLFEFLGYKYNEDKNGYRVYSVWNTHDNVIRYLIQLGVLAKGKHITEEEMSFINKLTRKEPINL